jgi:hypothetical protein
MAGRKKPNADALLADMRKRATPMIRTQCAFGKALEEMDPTTREVVQQAMTEGIGPGSIVDSLAAAGLPHAAKSTAYKHVKGKCQCLKS